MADDHHWVCDYCATRYELTQQPMYRVGERRRYCTRCIPDVFEAALISEEGWTGTGLDQLDSIDDFLALLSEELYENYQECVRVWRVAPHNRIWCPHDRRVVDENSGQGPGGEEHCNHFFGRRRPIEEDGRHQWAECPRCASQVCMACGREQLDAAEADRDGDCTPSGDMLAHAANLATLNRGHDGQVCPTCERITWLYDGCNEMRCPCTQTFCYICGAARRGGHGDRHWGDPWTGCPRWNQADDEDAGYDDPLADLSNIDGRSRNVEPLDGSANGRRWRNDALVVAEADRTFRVPRRVEIERGDIHQRRTARLILSSRHLLAMLYNGIERREGHWEAEIDSIHRRIRFAHHGALFRWYHNRLQRQYLERLDLPGGTEVYGRLSNPARRLRFQNGAVHDDVEERQREWIALREIVDDQLNVRFPLHRLTNNNIPDAENWEALWIRELLEPVQRMLVIIQRGLIGDQRVFTLADSTVLQIELDNLRMQLRRLHAREGGTDSFRAVGIDHDAAYEIAELFAHRLLEPDRSDAEVYFQLDDDEAIWTAGLRWVEEMMETIQAETRNFMREWEPEEMPQPIPALYQALGDTVSPLQDIIAVGNASVRNVSAGNLLAIRDLDLYLRNSGLMGAGGRGLRTVFYNLHWFVRAIVVGNEDRLPLPPPHSPHGTGSARSSLSSNANNDPSQDHRYITDTYIQILEAVVEHHRGPNRDTPLSPRSDRLRTLLPGLRDTALRLAEPHQHDGNGNQRGFDNLRDVYRQIQTRTAPFENFGDREPEGRVTRVMDRLMPLAETNLEINPNGREREGRMQRVVERMTEANELVEMMNEPTYIEGMLQRFLQDRHLWLRPDGTEGVAEQQFARFLRDLRELVIYNRLPPELRSEELTTRNEALHGELGRYDVHSTPVGDLQANFLQLYSSWHIIVRGRSPV